MLKRTIAFAALVVAWIMTQLVMTTIRTTPDPPRRRSTTSWPPPEDDHGRTG